MAQFKVPQNIDLEDKIIGPLTMAQFLYVLVGGMTIYVMVQTILPTQPAVFFVLAIPIGLFSLAMAFVKINDIPFPRFVQAAILFWLAPKRRIWAKVIDISTPTKIKPTKPAEAVAAPKKIEKSQIEKLASVLDTAGWAAVRDAQLKEFVTGLKDNSKGKGQNAKVQVKSRNF